MIRFLCFLSAAAALATTAGSARAGILYGATGTGKDVGVLAIINPLDGSYTVVGEINDAMGNNYRVTGLAFNPGTGVLYGATTATSPTNPSSLITINPSTGEATFVGGFGQGGQTMEDLTFRPDGTLYGWLEPFDSDLCTIDTATGASTLVGDSGLETFGSGLASDAAGTLYLAGGGITDDLYTIDPATGLPTVVATLFGDGSDGAIAAMAFDPSGVLFAVERLEIATVLHTINTATGEVMSRGQSIDRLDAIAFVPEAVPEPATLAMAATGALALAGFMRSSRRRRLA